MTTPLKLRVLLADNHALVRSGVRLVLEVESDIEVTVEAGDGMEALERALTAEIDLAILEVSMPLMTGLQVAAELRRRRPELRTLMLSMYDNEQHIFEALKAGASGYVLKTATSRDLVDACRASVRGEPFLYPPAVATIVRDHLDAIARGEAPPADLLTARELEVVKLIAEGHTSEEIAVQLVLSGRTVERHRANVLAKLGLRNRVELTRYAIRRGLVEP
jgi:DNA-binding NarL/FixJ family response regulator